MISEGPPPSRAPTPDGVQPHRLASAFDDAVIGMTLVAPDNTPVLVNNAFCEFLGYSKAQALALTQADVVHPQDLDEQLRQRALMLAGVTDSYRVERRYIHRDGRVLWADLSCRLVRDDAGRPLHFLSQLQDITQRRQAELELREAQKLMDIAGQIGQLGGWAYEASVPALTLSAQVRAMLGARPDFAPTPAQALSYLAPEHRDRIARVLRKCLHDGSPFDVEASVVTPMGRRIWLRVICEAEWGEDGRVRRLYGALQDVTPAKLAQIEVVRLNASLEERVRQRTREMQQANEELEALAYSIAHDLRAPMTALHGYASLLEQNLHDLDPPNAHYFSRIKSNVTRMSELTDALLSLARLSGVALARQPVDLAAMARQALDPLREADPQFAVTAEIPPALPAVGDAVLLQRVVSNLVGNAWKFSRPKGALHLRVGVEVLPDGERAFFVSDRGVGFDMAHAANLFGAFRRLHADDFDGTGIGLALVRKIVMRHGGRVWADARPGEGATFRFTLPAEPASR